MTSPGRLPSRTDDRAEPGPGALAQIADRVADCRACARLVAWREEVAATKRAAYRDEHYWARPVPGFGDPAARIVVLGLAPAAHGANRTGRIFTGDRSGDWLYRAMHRAGLANQPTAVARDDGLELRDAYVTSAVKCAPPQNKPTPAERERCSPWLARELAALGGAGADPVVGGTPAIGEARGAVMVVVCLGAFGYEAACRHFDLRPRPKFGHGVEVPVPGGPMLLCSFHPSQQNTFTKRLTEPMLDDVFRRAVELAGSGDSSA